MSKMHKVGTLAMVMCLMPLVVFAQAKPSSPPTVESKAGKATSQREMKIFISEDDRPISESAAIIPSNDWYLSKFDNMTTPEKMLQSGWSLLQIVKITAKQTYWVFVR